MVTERLERVGGGGISMMNEDGSLIIFITLGEDILTLQ